MRHSRAQYNTCFWALVQRAGLSPQDAQAQLRGSDAAVKNELLFSRFGINYNALPEQFRKGSTVVRRRQRVVAKTLPDGTPVERERLAPDVLHVDIIGDEFWVQNPELLRS